MCDSPSTKLKSAKALILHQNVFSFTHSVVVNKLILTESLPACISKTLCRFINASLKCVARSAILSESDLRFLQCCFYREFSRIGAILSLGRDTQEAES